MDGIQITVKPSTIARALGVSALLLVVVNIIVQLTIYLTGHDYILDLSHCFMWGMKGTFQLGSPYISFSLHRFFLRLSPHLSGLKPILLDFTGQVSLLDFC